MNAPADEDAIFRAQHVGASEIAALFDCHPWLTRYELWNRKAGTIPTPDFAGDERMRWGVLLEPVILDEACHRYDWEPVETPARLSNGKGLGGHPDRFVKRKSDGKILCVESKAVDWLKFKEWGDEPELHYLLQPQTYCGLGGLDGCAIVALVGGNQLEKWEFEFRPKLYAEAEKRTVAFWQSVEAGDCPKPEYGRDLDTIKALFGSTQTEVTADLTLDNRAAAAAAEYLNASEDVKAAQARKDAAQAELMEKMRDASFGMAQGFNIRTTLVAEVPDREAVAGEIIKGRKGYRRLTVREIAS